MLDEYIFGSATRISPEAPVMVLKQSGSKSVPGGAGNVAKNAAAFGAYVHVIGIAGADPAADDLKTTLQSSDRISAKLVIDDERPTTRKTRIMADSFHQMLRLDNESVQPVSGLIEAELIASIRSASAQADLLILSDYEKGCLTETISQTCIEAANSRNIPVVVNSKPKSSHLFKGATILSLNKAEVSGLTGDSPRTLDEAVQSAEKARLMLGVKCVVATMGGLGLAAAWEGGSAKAVAPTVEVSDVAGAGDTTICAIGLAFARAGFSQEVFNLAVHSGAKVVQHAGVAVLNQADLEALRTLA